VLIEVQGQHAERIPLHDQQVNEPHRQYADQPVLERNLTPESLNGSKLLAATIIAPAAGEFLLPELAIDWWDINAKMWRTSVLEPEAFEVIEKGAAQVTAKGGATTTTFTHALRNAFQRVSSLLPIISIVLGLLSIALAALCLRLWRRQKQLISDTSSTTFSTHNVPATEADAWRVLKKKLDRKEPDGIRQALINWARKSWPKENFQTLEQLRLFFPELDKPLSDLDRLLYSRQVNTQLEQPFNTEADKQLKALRKQLLRIRKNRVVGSQLNGLDSKQGELKPLYRIT